jgi:hypothetical protein
MSKCGRIFIRIYLGLLHKNELFYDGVGVSFGVKNAEGDWGRGIVISA